MARSVLFTFLFLIITGNMCVAGEPLRILAENWPPMGYEENGKKSGMAVELTHLLQKKVDRDSKVVTAVEIVPFARGYHTVLNRPNTLLFTVARTAEREKKFHFLGPIANGEIQLFAKPGSPASKNPEHVNKNLLVSAVRGTVYEGYLQEHGFKNVILVSDPLTNIKLLMSGRVDLICDDTLVISELTRRAGYPSVDLPKIYFINTTSLYYAFSKGTNVAILESWKSALEEVKKNGEFKSLYAKWFKNLTPSLDVVLTNYEPQKTTLKKDARPLGVAAVK